MKFLIRFILILIFGFFALRYFPFWAAVVVAFLVGLILSEQRKRRVFGKNSPPPFSFLAGFISMALLWGVFSFLTDHQNASLLSHKVAQLITPNPGASSHFLLISAATLIGGLLGGLGALTGNLLGEAIRN